MQSTPQPYHAAVVPIALGSVHSSTEESRAFLQQRLGLFGMWVFCLSVGSLLTGVGVTLVFDPDGYWGWGVSELPNFFRLAATLVPGGVWLLSRKTTMPFHLLRRLDAGALIATCALFALMAAALSRQPIIATFVALLAATHMVVFRAVTVPSSAKRTAWISVVAFAPIFATTVYLLRFFGTTPMRAGGFTVWTFMWCALAVAVSGVASSVIFGLRREARVARQLGQYTLEGKIGEGGMGVVYRASHMMLRRPTAIKLLPPEKAGEVSIKRFEREVRMTARLSHPNTVAIYDYGRTPDGVFYYAMEFLDGLDLQALVQRHGPQSPERVIHILTQVCGALAEAHAVELIHRDIKPANIILTERGGEPDVAKVVDFGLVKHVDTGGTDVTVTAQNLLVGSPLYMSPEAIKSPEGGDARSDIYAVGAVGYYLLTGQPVFDGDTFVEICSQHLQSEPTSPSARLGSAVPADLETLVLDCLAKDPVDRPASAQALAGRLRTCRSAGAWTRERAASWWTEQRARPRPDDASATTPLASVAVEIDLLERMAPEE